MIDDELIAQALRGYYAGRPTSGPDHRHVIEGVLAEVHLRPPGRLGWLRRRRPEGPPRQGGVIPSMVERSWRVADRDPRAAAPSLVGVAASLAVALAVVAGGVALMARSVGPSAGGAPPDAAGLATTAEGSPAPRPPAEFTGRVLCGPPLRPEIESTLPVGEGMAMTRIRDGAWRQMATVSDPRLVGSWYHTWESDRYLALDAESGPTVNVGTWRIENDDGAWQGGAIEAVLRDGTGLDGLTLLVGEGAYEGLTAIVEVKDVEGMCAADIRGIIVADPPAIEPYEPG